jgi:carbamoyltransferase
MRILAFNITHDSAVCSINNGKLEYFCKEERLSKIKRDKHPFKALEKYRSLNFGPIDHILYLTPTNNEADIELMYKIYCEKTFGIIPENFSALQHHLCHASLAFYNSKFDRALVFVIDRNGSVFFIKGNCAAREAESVFLFVKNKPIIALHKSFWVYPEFESKKHIVKNLISKEFPNCNLLVNNGLSIVKVYEAATTLLGQPPLENGKTMGLSAYGRIASSDKLFLNDGVPISEKFTHLDTEENPVSFYYPGVESDIGKMTEDDYQWCADKAKLVQIETQDAALSLIKKYVQTTSIRNVCIVGGYGLNVVANNHYVKNLPDVNFYFEPVADDTGIPVGAAMIKYNSLTNIVPEAVSDNFYHYYDSSENLNRGESTTINKLINLLIEQKSLAIFEGNPEAGPRALGHRSILFDPRNPDAKKIVNKIKKREWYRPFAGVILESEFKNYFDTTGLDSSPYMTVNFDCLPIKKDKIPGVVHVDGTCRVQTVSEGFLYELLLEFYKQTGCPVLLNTSFNLAGLPLVQTKEDAITTLKNCELDAVYFVDDKKIVTKDDS